MTLEQKNKFIGFLSANGCNIDNALEFYKIDKKRYEQEIIADAIFRTEINLTKQAAFENVKSAMYKKALEGDSAAAKLFLEMNKPITTLTDPLGLGI